MSDKKTININLNKKLHDVKGEKMMSLKRDEWGDPILKETGPNGRPIYEKEAMTMRDVVVTSLTQSTPEELKNPPSDGRKKLKMYNLATKVMAAKNNFNFTPSQVALICKRANVMYQNPVVVALTWKAFNYKTTDEEDFDS